MKAWLRELKVELISASLKKKFVFGDNWRSGKDDMAITVTGSKYLSSAKDQFTVKISNLTYNEICQLIAGQYYYIKIYAGYRSSSENMLFNGYVIYISNQLNSDRTSTAIILCGSKLRAKYGQSRMNLNINSGINMAAAIKFIMKRAGVTNANIDEDLANRIVKQNMTVKSTSTNWLETFAATNDMIVNTDSTYSNDVTVIYPYRTNNRVITLTEKNCVIIGDYPQLSSDGLTMTVLPTFNFMPSDVIVVDNSIIDISTENAKKLTNANFLDENGKYLITQLDYNLQNRGTSFSVSITARARSLYSSINTLKGQTA